VSTNKQKNDLNNQIDQLKQWCFMNGYTINAIYSDIASGISFENRKGFFEMLDEILNYRIEKVVITYKDRLSRVGFELFKYLFQRFGTEIVVISEVGNAKLDSEEVFEEIRSMLHCYSMKMYSKRRNHSIEVGYES
ncbi:MAG: IS607 family transposase, partial [Thermoplasmata archaeon]